MDLSNVVAVPSLDSFASHIPLLPKRQFVVHTIHIVVSPWLIVGTMGGPIMHVDGVSVMLRRGERHHESASEGTIGVSGRGGAFTPFRGSRGSSSTHILDSQEIRSLF